MPRRRWLVLALTSTLGCGKGAPAPANNDGPSRGAGGAEAGASTEGLDGAGGAGGLTGDASSETIDGPVGGSSAGVVDSADGLVVDASGVEANDADDGDAPGAEAARPVGCAGLLCEDFESGRIDPAKWDLQTGAGGTLVVQQQVVAHGRFALQVHGLAGPSDYAFIVTKAAPAALQAAPFGRASFLITPKPLTSGHTEMVFAGTNGPGAALGPGPFPKLRYMEVANINGGWQIGLDLLDVAPLFEAVAYPAGSPRVPVGTWACLEWQFSDQPDVVKLWIDGQATGAFDDQHVSYPSGHAPGSPLYDGKSSGLIGGFTTFGFGFHDWHPNKPFDLYYDDLVLDTKRVGCLP